MEDRTVPLISSVPTFAQGLKVLLVHNDTLSLVNLSSMLEKYSFTVTVTDEANAAVSLICQQEKGQFNLVMAKASMPDMDTLSFLHFLLEKNIPVIFISSGGYNDVTWKALAKSSCYFLEEPILLQDLKYLWQHAYHTKANFTTKTHKTNCENKVHGTLDDRICIQKEKRKMFQMNFDNNLTAAMEEEEDIAREQNFYGHAEKRSRIVWTQKLHQKFLDAISVLSDKNNIRPKAILEQMNVPNLTARQISSHLQKYKTQELINQQAHISGFNPTRKFSNNDGGKSQSSSQFQSQGYSGFPASTAILSGSQNRNQCLLNFIETQGQDMPQMEESPPFPDEFPTALSNDGSPNQDAVVGQPMPDASMDQNRPMTAHDTIKMLVEDCDQYDYSQSGVLRDQIDKYSEMLRNTLLGNSSGPQEPDI